MGRRRLRAADVRALRLRSSLLDGTQNRTPAEVVSWFGAVQAQDWPGARWAVGQRAAATTTSTTLDELLTAGTILRTHVLRPTWHLVTPADIRWMLALTAARIRAGSRSRLRDLGIEELTTRATAVIADAIEREGPLTRAQLQTELGRAGIDGGGQRMPHLLAEAELDAVICSGGLAGSRQTYALLDTRAPAARAFDRDEVLGELTVRYLQGHGPAQLRDLCWWAGLSVGDARRGLAIAGDRVEEVDVDGAVHLDLAGREPAPAAVRRGVHLLPNWDEYLVAYADRTLHVDRTVHPVMPSSADLLTNTVVAGGFVVGAWRRTERRDGAAVSARPARRLRPAERAGLDAAVSRYASFLGRPATLAVEVASPAAGSSSSPAGAVTTGISTRGGR